MLTTTSNYDTENAKLSKKKSCVIITFDGIADPKFSSNTFGDWSATYKKLIGFINYETPEYVPFEPLLTRAKLTFSLIDKDGDIISLINGNILLNTEVTCKIGYVALDEADFVTLPKFFIRKIEIGSDMMEHVFICEETDDFDVLYNDTIYKSAVETFLTVDEAAAAAIMDVGSTAGFIDPAAPPAGVGSPAIMIDGDIITYTGITGTTFTGCTHGVHGSTDQAHGQGSKVRPVYFMKQNFAQVMLRVLTTTATGVNGRYDSSIADFGPKIDDALFDDQQIEREGYRFHCSYEPTGAEDNLFDEEFHYFIYKEMKIIDFLRDILVPFNAVLHKSTAGLLQLKVMDLPRLMEDISSETMNDNNMSINSLEFLDYLLINEINMRYDLDPTIEKFQRNETDILFTRNDESRTAYGGYPIKQMQNKGLDYFFPDSRWFHQLDRLFLYYGNMLIKAELSALESKWLYEPLDDLKITSAFYPNYRTGNRVWTGEEALVMQKNVMIDARTEQYEVLYKMLFFYLSKKASSLYTLVVRDGDDGDWDAFDTDVALNALNDETTQGDDGKADYAGNETGINYIYVKLLIVIPAGADAEETMHVSVRAIEYVPAATVNARNSIEIAFNSSWDKTITVYVPLIILNNTDNVLRIKTDWYATSAAGGNVPTSVTIDKYYIYKMTHTA